VGLLATALAGVDEGADALVVPALGGQVPPEAVE